MAISCSASAFKTPLAEALGEIAHLGFRHVDLIGVPSWGHIIPAELAEDFDGVAGRVETLLARNGLSATALGCAFANPYERDDEAVNAQRLREVDACAHLASRLGAGVVSFYPGYKAPGEPAGDLPAATAATLREMLPVGAAHGITVAPEPHFATPLEELDVVRGLLGELPELTVVYDPSHWAMQEIDLRETEFMLARTCHVHLRDAAPGKMQTPFGAGTVDFDWILDALAERRYAGRFAIEYLPDLEGGDVTEQITRLRDALAARLG
ncbi:MAG TPA: sugar phosphate isomerase/epimerase [Phycisphaerae bacterium]|nr:sugar phosphate isomerase/epimerase [Phycisphaerae bacterium]